MTVSDKTEVQFVSYELSMMSGIVSFGDRDSYRRSNRR